MAERANSQLSAEVAAAFAWWREAGVDHAFVDEAVDWIIPTAAGGSVETPPKPHQAAAPAAPPPAPAVDPALFPQDLAGLTAWWLSEPWLDEGRVTERIPPRGEVGAEVMIIVPEPEREDREQLLDGPQGRLLGAMLAAMGLGAEQVYLASALPRHTPMADWAAAGQRGLGEVLRHHVTLVAPRRLIVFGANALPLLGNGLANSGLFSLELNHGGLSIPLWAATDLGILLARPRAKARLWQQWLDWTGTEQT